MTITVTDLARLEAGLRKRPGEVGPVLMLAAEIRACWAEIERLRAKVAANDAEWREMGGKS